MSLSQLKKIYEARGFYRADVARHMGMSENMVYKWEVGSRNINGDQLRKLADFLTCTTDQILGRTPFEPNLLTAPLSNGSQESGTVAKT